MSMAHEDYDAAMRAMEESYEKAIKQLESAQERGVILGLDILGLGAVERMDVDVLLSKYPDTFNLYILALEEISKQDNKDKMSYYEIAGIHGLPFRAWSDVTDGPIANGYCPHGTVLFPTWHRAYLLMIEQTLYYHMHRIAESFPESERKRWVDAVKNFRHPFWDYYRPRDYRPSGKQAKYPGVQDSENRETKVDWEFSVPKVFTEPVIQVVRPQSEGKWTVMDNPLFTYEFLSDPPMQEQWDAYDEKVLEDEKKRGTDLSTVWFSNRAQTVRYPRKNRDLISMVTKMNQTIQMNRAPGVEYLVHMMENEEYKKYETFAATGLEDDGETPIQTPLANGSLEGLHNRYHLIIGGTGGHMSRVPTAAFDPIFWLHHTNIDRYFAIWQAVHDGWITDVASDYGTYELLPFKTDKTVEEGQKFWNNNSLRNVSDLGYTYSDISGTKQEVLENLRHNYVWSLHTTLSRNIPDEPPSNMAPIDVMKTQFFTFVHPDPVKAIDGEKKHEKTWPTKKLVVEDPSELQFAVHPDEFEKSDEELLAGLPAGTRLIRQWYIDSKVLRNAHDDAFSIYYFLGGLDKDEPECYHHEATLIALDHIFVNSQRNCKNCATQAAKKAYAFNTSPITSKLLTYVENNELPLECLHPKNVLAFMNANLKWRVLGSHMVPLKDEDVDLKVSVSSTISFLYPEEIVPKFHAASAFHEVTGINGRFEKVMA
ncbi:Di-copper centre-containing protein [Ascobolus immersus RN42]|uniref:tyrosinase n=1 Tax=Ascobolus immersus RN42 TaxID=1160509 RepID=A0A3N4HNW1_ASCIM|nr:Di-copper centre-containing protein [Ascobolus immersus RN42]